MTDEASTLADIALSGARLRAAAMPLGGVGAGHYCIAGDGSLRQWQIFNIPNHRAFLPGTFFALRTSQGNRSVGRLLQTRGDDDDPGFTPAPLVNDHEVPVELQTLRDRFQGVDDISFTGEYPVATLQYVDDELPVDISCTVLTPMVPLDAESSGLPAAIYRFTIQRKPNSNEDVQVALLASLQNAVGYDGVSMISGVEYEGYGGNRNEESVFDRLHAVEMTNGWLKEDDPANGSMVLAAPLTRDTQVEAYTAWADPARFLRDFFRRRRKFTGYLGEGSTRGHTWNGALVQRIALTDDAPQTLTVYHTWHFPNFYVNWDSPPQIEGDRNRFWIGKRYAARYESALEVAQSIVGREDDLWDRTQHYHDALYRTTLPAAITSRVGNTSSIMRSPTTFWDYEGRFFGFEGCNGASANWRGHSGGCCPLNCTHVWQYEQTLAWMYPELERTMRDTEFFHQQSPDGFIQHRVALPLMLPPRWDDPQEGPEGPALDGMLGIVLRTYREIRMVADGEWFRTAWPRVQGLMDHCISKFDPDESGVISGEQPNTYDISIYGPNTFIGSLYLAALRAAEEMAGRRGDSGSADRYRGLFEKGKEAYDRLCWNGDYYIQLTPTATDRQNAYGEGCHSEQLIGQWWAHMLDLGYVLPEEHVRVALAAIVKHNFRSSFAGFEHHMRVYADGDDAGLLMASWPHGGRPEKPTRYCDEVWTGVEYEVAALCLYEDRPEDAVRILNAICDRHDGSRRNPWNEIECGDHYARAMSSYGVLLAASGFCYDSPNAHMTFKPKLVREDFRSFFAAGTGWGMLSQRTRGLRQMVEVGVEAGSVEIRQLDIHHLGHGKPSVTTACQGQQVATDAKWDGSHLVLRFGNRLSLNLGDRLNVTIG